MTQEEKGLLLKDLCARLYTGTMVNYNDIEGCDYELTIRTLSNFPEEKLKCYLRPMSSMTEEEKEEYYATGNVVWDNETYIAPVLDVFEMTDKTFDWLNKNKFDYRGLIEKGLALEAPEDMYKEKLIRI